MAGKFTRAQLEQIKIDQENQLNFDAANPILDSADNIMSGSLPSETVGSETPIEDIANTSTITGRPAPTTIGGLTPNIGDPARGIGVVPTQFDYKNQSEAGDVAINVNSADPFAVVSPTLATPEESKGLLQSTVSRGAINREDFSEEKLKAIPALIPLQQQLSNDELKYGNNEAEYITSLYKATSEATTSVNNIFDSDSLAITNEQKTQAFGNAQNYLNENADEVNYIIRSVDLLNMSEDSSDINSPLKKDLGPIIATAAILEVAQILSDQASEVDDDPSEMRYSNDMSKEVIGPRVGAKIEQMIFSSKDLMETPNKSGLPSDYGYLGRLSGDQKSLLGQISMDAMARSPLFDFITEEEVIDINTGKPKTIYNTTRLQYMNLNRVVNAIKDMVGESGPQKPVRHSKKSKGRLAPMSEKGAYKTSKMTKNVSKTDAIEEMDTARFKADNIVHTVPPQIPVIYAGFLKAGLDAAALQMNGTDLTSSAAAKFTKQDYEYYQDKVQDYLEDYLLKEEKAGLKIEDLKTYDPLTGAPATTFIRAAQLKADGVVARHRERWERRISEGFDNIGKPIYFDNRSISFSQRMFGSQDELNYWLDKIARGLLHGAYPTIFKKTGETKSLKGQVDMLGTPLNVNDFYSSVIDSAIEKSKKNLSYDKFTDEENYHRIMARTLIPDADKYIFENYANLLGAYKEKYTELVSLGQQINEYKDSQKSAVATPEAIDYSAQNPTAVGAMAISASLNEYLESIGKDEFYYALNNLPDLALYDAKSIGQEYATKAKAGIDGVANGATIIGYQLGIEEIITRGGILLNGKETIEEDLRDYVFNKMSQLPEIKSDKGDPDQWDVSFRAMAADNKKKELMKGPVMTTMYGLEADFQKGAAEKFVKKNPKYFKHLDETNPTKIIEGLKNYMADGLKLGLGPALDHANLAKRIGRLFVFADEPAILRGPQLGKLDSSRFPLVAIGVKSIVTSDDNYMLGIGATPEGQDMATTRIRTTKAIPSASEAKASKLISAGGVRSNPGPGTGIIDKIPVASTTAQDAAVVIRYLNEELEPDEFFMQIYDGAIGDVKSFFRMSEAINKIFLDVVQNYKLLEEEELMVINLKKKFKLEAENNPDGVKDLSSTGRYAYLGDFLSNGFMRNKTIERDLPFRVSDNRISNIDNTKASPEDTRHKANYERVKAVQKNVKDIAINLGRNNRYAATKQLNNVEFNSMFNELIIALGTLSDITKSKIEAAEKQKAIADKIRKTMQYK